MGVSGPKAVQQRGKRHRRQFRRPTESVMQVQNPAIYSFSSQAHSKSIGMLTKGQHVHGVEACRGAGERRKGARSAAKRNGILS